MIELLILNAGYTSVEEFVRRQSRMVPRLDGLYSAVLILKTDEGYEYDEPVYCDDIYLRGEVGGVAEEG